MLWQRRRGTTLILLYNYYLHLKYFFILYFVPSSFRELTSEYICKLYVCYAFQDCALNIRILSRDGFLRKVNTRVFPITVLAVAYSRNRRQSMTEWLPFYVNSCYINVFK